MHVQLHLVDPKLSYKNYFIKKVNFYKTKRFLLRVSAEKVQSLKFYGEGRIELNKGPKQTRKYID